ncbi:hypothetical protein [Kushneria konosiri]|uniref:Uncharacterized protein n=1 Tax=Kushneria konosiri TaxID=698828 RepID=A0A2Z2H565_9GAMM|nr:hypothetical protein [Kushneria konosiri]ARS52492.1 hypothetical protein B9G99_06030 [Kushneria konosiri]
MALMTPLGRLDTLDIDCPNTQMTLLSMDKHRLLEGLVVEALIEGILSRLEAHGAVILPLSLVRAGRRGRQTAWWLWAHRPMDDTDALFDALSVRHPRAVVRCHYDRGRRDFLIERYPGHDGSPLQAFLMRLCQKGSLDFRHPDPDVCEALRTTRAFWRMTECRVGIDMFHDIVLHRLYKNCVLAPFFDWLWDIDTILQLPNGQQIQLEIKHKYPYQGRGGLCFGINKGQVMTMQALAESDIDTFHVILVKPWWDRATGPGYLTQDHAHQDQVLVIGHYLDLDALKALSRAVDGESGITESLYGRRAQAHKGIAAAQFVLIGTLADSAETLARNLLAGALRQPLPRLTDECLRKHRRGPGG